MQPRSPTGLSRLLSVLKRLFGGASPERPDPASLDTSHDPANRATPVEPLEVIANGRSTMAAKRLPNESPDYQTARAELLAAEIALKDQREQVAELRRQLPEGPIVEDYVFREGSRDLDNNSPMSMREVRLSELFDEDHDQLVLIHFMYGGAQTDPCPMCTMWTDGYNGVAEHVRQKACLALVAEADLSQLRAWARERGWDNIRLLSSAGSTFKRDLRMADEDGSQHPGVSIFTRNPDGSVRHIYTCEAVLAEGHWRGVDLLSPVWHLFDLLPQGRGDWNPRISYD